LTYFRNWEFSRSVLAGDRKLWETTLKSACGNLGFLGETFLGVMTVVDVDGDSATDEIGDGGLVVDSELSSEDIWM
jgi:hypothetical protein